jgi:hypothetical protein
MKLKVEFDFEKNDLLELCKVIDGIPYTKEITSITPTCRSNSVRVEKNNIKLDLLLSLIPNIDGIRIGNLFKNYIQYYSMSYKTFQRRITELSLNKKIKTELKFNMNGLAGKTTMIYKYE